MESSGLPERIQISEKFKEDLLANFINYICILRDDKKNDLVTYWLQENNNEN